MERPHPASDALENRPDCALSDVETGAIAVVRVVNADVADAALLRAMGLRPAARVRVFRTGEPCVVQVLRTASNAETQVLTRIALSAPLARRVRVMRESLA